MHLLFVSGYLCIAWHIPPLIPFSTISNKLTSVNNSNFICVFFKHAFHANPNADENELDQGHIFQCICF